MAKPTRVVVACSKYEHTGWVREGSTETITVTAHLTDGTAVTRTEQMTYKPGEREGILERALSNRGTPEDLRRVRAVLTERHAKKERAFGDIQSSFHRNGIVT